MKGIIILDGKLGFMGLVDSLPTLRTYVFLIPFPIEKKMSQRDGSGIKGKAHNQTCKRKNIYNYFVIGF